MSTERRRKRSVVDDNATPATRFECLLVCICIQRLSLHKHQHRRVDAEVFVNQSGIFGIQPNDNKCSAHKQTVEIIFTCDVYFDENMHEQRSEIVHTKSMH